MDSDSDGYRNIIELNAVRRAWTSSDKPTAAVALSTPQNAKSGSASTTVSYSVTVTNNGNLTDSFTLNVSVTSGQATWTPTIVGTANNVAAGGTAGITVNVAIPAGATVAQSSVATVTAVSQANTSISATPRALTTSIAPPVPRYVNAATGSDTTTCTNSAAPCKTITYAMTHPPSGASPGDTINVAPGTYSVALGEVFPIAIKSGVQLLATGTAANTIVDATGANKRVFNASGSNASTVMQGFTITGGLHLDDGSNVGGGAMRIDNSAEIEVRRNIFTGNEVRGFAGAGEAYEKEGYGGAISSAGNPTIENNVFSNNTARGGVGVAGSPGGDGGNAHGGAFFGSASIIANNTFYNNTTQGGAGGASSGQGGDGGLAFSSGVEAGSATLVINNIFVNHTSIGGVLGTGSPNGANGNALGGAMSFGSSPTKNLFFGNSNNGDTGTTPVLQDPQFHSAPSNLRIRLASPAKAAGQSSGAPVDDLDGTTRPNPPSIGAFEASAVATTTALASSANPSTIGQSVTFTATVSGSGGTPAGTATFKDGGSTLCAAVTLATAQAQCATSSLSIASHSITAEYSGDAVYAASASVALSQVVQAPPSFTLTVNKTGAGAGTVTSSPAGINCGATCAASFNSGSAVTLTAAASAGSTFGGWSGGGCSGTGGCTVTMNAAATVTATFNVAPAGTFALTVGKTGSGSGTVTSSPAGIACGSTCVADFSSGALVTISATASSGSNFAGWSGGGCSGTGGCTVTLNAATTVTATFNANASAAAASPSPTSIDFGGQSMGTTAPPRTVTVTNSGGTTLTISAVSVSNSQFSQSNDCASVAPSATCTITVYFSPAPAAGALNSTVAIAGTLTITSNGTGSPNSVSLAGTAEKSLVTHYYLSILGRAPDAGGKTYWEGEGARVQSLGADVREVYFAMSIDFFNSQEYRNRNTSNSQYLTDLYRTFFSRAPDSGGLQFWTDNLNAGMDRGAVLGSFLFSTEFSNTMTGIFGVSSPRPEINVTIDLYRGILGRLPDTAGFNFYLGRIRAAQCLTSGAAAAVSAEVNGLSQQFFSSPEYGNIANARPPAERVPRYMGDVYNAIMRRGPDLAGYQFYVNQINTGGKTAEQVRAEFVQSPEFQGRVSAVLAAGCF